jgi:DNA repair protein RadC
MRAPPSKENSDQGKIEFVEHLKVMFMNRANKVLGILDVSTGGLTGCRPKSKLCSFHQSGGMGIHCGSQSLCLIMVLAETKKARTHNEFGLLVLFDFYPLELQSYNFSADQGHSINQPFSVDNH